MHNVVNIVIDVFCKMKSLITLNDIRELISLSHKEHHQLPKEIVFGTKHFMEFVHLFQDMGRLVPEKFDGVPYNKDDSIIGFYLKK